MIVNFHEWMAAKQQFDEIKHDLATELDVWQRENPLPFDNLFPDNTLRTIVPFSTDPIPLQIIDKFQKLGYHLDLKHGMAVKGQRSTRLGKLILQKPSQNKPSLFTPQEQQWWSTQGNALESLEYANGHKDYAVIVSRSPYDIVRMSDHAELSSCHSQGGDYFHCAISEAKGGGPIAYVVNRHELENIPDLQAPEIFEDDDRSHRRGQGIQPISRIRLRLFKNKKDDYDLAIPEVRTYGKKIPGFPEVLRNWAMENQQDVLKGQRPKMKDFVRMGGSYADNIASKLFNTFFGDESDRGDTSYEGEEGQNIADQYQEEIDAIDESNKGKFKFCYVSASVEGDEGEPYVHYNGGIYLSIPIEVHGLPGWEAHGQRRGLKDKVKELCGELNIWGVEDVEFEDDRGLTVRVDIRDDENGMHPDSYREFCRYMLNDVEPKENNFRAGIISILTELGYVDPHYVSKFLGHSEVEPDWNQPVFQHFQWEEDDDMPNAHAIVVSPKEVMPIGNMAGLDAEFLYGWRSNIPDGYPGFQEIRSQILGHLNQVADQSIRKSFNQTKKQQLLWGQPEPKKKGFTGSFNIQPQITFTFDKTYNIFMNMAFQLNVGQPEEDVKDAMEFVKHLDDTFDSFMREGQRLFSQLVLPKYKKIQPVQPPQPEPVQVPQIPTPPQPEQVPAWSKYAPPPLPKTESVTDFLTWLKKQRQQRHSHI